MRFKIGFLWAGLSLKPICTYSRSKCLASWKVQCVTDDIFFAFKPSKSFWCGFFACVEEALVCMFSWLQKAGSLASCRKRHFCLMVAVHKNEPRATKFAYDRTSYLPACQKQRICSELLPQMAYDRTLSCGHGVRHANENKKMAVNSALRRPMTE